MGGPLLFGSLPTGWGVLSREIRRGRGSPRRDQPRKIGPLSSHEPQKEDRLRSKVHAPVTVGPRPTQAEPFRLSVLRLLPSRGQADRLSPGGVSRASFSPHARTAPPSARSVGLFDLGQRDREVVHQTRPGFDGTSSPDLTGCGSLPVVITVRPFRQPALPVGDPPMGPVRCAMPAAVCGGDRSPRGLVGR